MNRGQYFHGNPAQHQNEPPLPPGWVAATDPNSGKTYYCNPQTRETKWERPTVTPSIARAIPPAMPVSHLQQRQHQQQRQQQNPLPPGWVEAIDQSSGKTYYCNPQTRETKWERPSSLPSIPSATHPGSSQHIGFRGNISSIKTGHINNNQGRFNGTGTGITHPESNPLMPSSSTAPPTGSNNKNDDDDFDELACLTGGQLAYLAKIQQRQEQNDSSNETESKENESRSKYVPLDLSLLSSISTTERAEPGRLDVRMYALRGELKKFGYIES